MSLREVHVILTYRCTQRCDHCFVFGGPHQDATFRPERLHEFLDQLSEIDTLEWVYFEGGEPFLYYPTLVEGVEHASRLGLSTGVVTNGFWYTGITGLRTWLKPLMGAGLRRLQLSADRLHNKKRAATFERAHKRIEKVVQWHRMDYQVIEVKPKEPNEEPTEARAGENITGGQVANRGRAATNLVEKQALWDWETFPECPHERLDSPLRVHVDPTGSVQICQGISMGSVEAEPLHEILEKWPEQKEEHPIVGPLLRGGPTALVKEHGLEHEEGYSDACHLCFDARLKLLRTFPAHLNPSQVYGLRE